MAEVQAPKAVDSETLLQRVRSTSKYALPVLATTNVTVAFLTRFYPQLGSDLIIALGASAGLVMNYVIDLILYIKEKKGL